MGDFLDRYWLQKSAAAYLHQWQFPLSKTAVPKLCYRCDPPPCLDEDLLKHWLDICLGDNPLQYLFMGEASTSSKLHIDPGGLDLLIAPIIGEKQVTLVHRDDSELIMATVHDDDESDDDDAAATSPDGFDATHSSLTRETRLPPSRRARARARARSAGFCGLPPMSQRPGSQPLAPSHSEHAPEHLPGLRRARAEPSRHAPVRRGTSRAARGAQRRRGRLGHDGGGAVRR